MIIYKLFKKKKLLITCIFIFYEIKTNQLIIQAYGQENPRIKINWEMIFWIILTNQGYVESVQRHFVPCKLFSEYFFLSCRLVRQCSCTYFSLDSKSFFFITNLVGLWSLFHWIFCLLFCLAFLFMNNNATSISFSKKKKRKKRCVEI